MNPVVVRAEVNHVQINFQDFVFVEVLFHVHRQDEFFSLARESLVAGEEKIFDGLLRDSRGALLNFARLHIDEDGAGNSEQVKASVRVKARIFDGNDGLAQKLRHVVQRGVMRNGFKLFVDGGLYGSHSVERRQQSDIFGLPRRLRRNVGNGRRNFACCLPLIPTGS